MSLVIFRIWPKDNHWPIPGVCLFPRCYFELKNLFRFTQRPNLCQRLIKSPSSKNKEVWLKVVNDIMPALVFNCHGCSPFKTCLENTGSSPTSWIVNFLQRAIQTCTFVSCYMNVDITFQPSTNTNKLIPAFVDKHL